MSETFLGELVGRAAVALGTVGRVGKDGVRVGMVEEDR